MISHLDAILTGASHNFPAVELQSSNRVFEAMDLGDIACSDIPYLRGVSRIFRRNGERNKLTRIILSKLPVTMLFSSN